MKNYVVADAHRGELHDGLLTTKVTKKVTENLEAIQRQKGCRRSEIVKM